MNDILYTTQGAKKQVESFRPVVDTVANHQLSAQIWAKIEKKVQMCLGLYLGTQLIVRIDDDV